MATPRFDHLRDNLNKFDEERLSLERLIHLELLLQQMAKFWQIEKPSNVPIKTALIREIRRAFALTLVDRPIWAPIADIARSYVVTKSKAMLDTAVAIDMKKANQASWENFQQMTQIQVLYFDFLCSTHVLMDNIDYKDERRINYLWLPSAIQNRNRAISFFRTNGNWHQN